MPVSCCAVNCTNRKVKGCTKSFFRIPHEPERRAAWLRALKRSEFQDGRETSPTAWTPKGHERVCSDHFISGKRSTDPAHPDYVPSLFNLPASASGSTNPSAWLKFKSAKKEWFKNKKHVVPTKQDKPVASASIDALAGNKRHAVNSTESTEKKCDDSPSKSSDYFADDVISVDSKSSPTDLEYMTHNPFKTHPKDLSPSPSSSSAEDDFPTPPKKLPREEAKTSVKNKSFTFTKAFSWKIPAASSVDTISSDSDSDSDIEDKWKRPQLSYRLNSKPGNDKSSTKGSSSDVRDSKTTGKTSTVTPEPRSAILRGSVKIGESGLTCSSQRNDEADSQGFKNKGKRRNPEEIQEKKGHTLKQEKEQERQRKKGGKEQKRGTKKKMKEVEAAKKRAEKEAIKRMRPGECLKFITLQLDRHLAESEWGDQILIELQGTGSTVQIVDQPVPYSVTWKRTVTRHDFGEDAQLGSVSTKDTEEDETLVYVPVADFVHLVYNYKKQQQGDSSSKETLQSFVNGIKAHTGKKVTLLILGLQKYFTTQHQKQFRDEVQNNNVMTEDSKEKKKKKKKRKHVISRIDVEEALVHLQMWESVNVKMLEEPQEMADLVRMYSKAVAEAPFKRLREQSSFSFHIETSGSSVKVDKDGRGLLKVWSKHIQQMRNVSAEMSAAIVAEYPSPQLLLQAYQGCSSEQEAQLLLKDITVRRGAGVLATCRRIGPEVSKRLHTFFTSRDGEILLQSAT